MLPGGVFVYVMNTWDRKPLIAVNLSYLRWDPVTRSRYEIAFICAVEGRLSAPILDASVPSIHFSDTWQPRIGSERLYPKKIVT